MALRLRPMSAAELEEFLPRGEEGYVQQLVDFAGMTDDEAKAKAARDYASVFPGGRLQENHFAFVVEDAGGQSVGYVVCALRGGGTKAWLYELEIDPSERGRGYGREALRLFEEDARRRGVREVGLNVFPGNEVARSLYSSTGYRDDTDEAGWMIKRLDEPK